MFHNVELRAHCHATEEPERVERALRTLSPDCEPEMEKAEGHYGNPILLMRCRLEGDAIDGFWRRVRDAGVLPRILDGLEDRVDENAVLHVRLDKQRAFAGEIDLTLHDDVIAVRAKIAAHPAKKSAALRAAQAYFQRL